jgi:hypothetical protein
MMIGVHILLIIFKNRVILVIDMTFTHMRWYLFVEKSSVLSQQNEKIGSSVLVNCQLCVARRAVIRSRASRYECLQLDRASCVHIPWQPYHGGGPANKIHEN